MNKRIQKLHDLSDLLKSNDITKEEFEILKKGLFSDIGGDINVKTKLNDSYRQRVAELQLLSLKSNIDKRPASGKSNTVKPSIETQNKNRTSTISKDETVSSKAIFGIGLLFFGIVLLFVLGLSFYDKNASQSTNSNSSSSSPSSTSNSYEQPQESSTMANCVVCGKRVDYYQENTFSGHHFKVSGLMSSDVVCGLECDVTLRRRNERTINREMTDPNSYRDPDIKMPDFNK